GDIVESVYQSELGRASDPGGKAGWINYAQGLRDQGKTDEQIRAALVDKFHQSEEYKAKHPAAVAPTGVQPAAVAPAQIAPANGGVYQPFEVAPGASVNGRLGAHWPSDTWGSTDPAQRAQLISEMQKLGVGYCTVLVDPNRPEANDAAIRELMAAGITPTVRLMEPGPMDQWSGDDIEKMGDAAVHLQQLGVKLIQVGNEPNHNDESKLGDGASPERRAEYQRRCNENLVAALVEIRDRCGDSVKLGLPPMAPGTPNSGGYFDSHQFYRSMCQAVAAAEKPPQKLVDWIPTHNYVAIGNENIPDGRGGFGSPNFNDYARIASQEFHRDLRALSTEGGSHPSHWQGSQDEGELQALMQNMESNGGATTCLWLLYGDNWSNHALLHGEGDHGDALEYLRRHRRGEA
ncbi:MAG: hypothetical protein JXR83_09340, partial [Deltaproteobacteria bacterium]|nr:hypothetical protein [Deltaproteobacteria bacterium]